MPISYLDRAWCLMSFSNQGDARCTNTECGRHATDEHIERARKFDLAFCKINFCGEDCGYRVAGEEPAA